MLDIKSLGKYFVKLYLTLNLGEWIFKRGPERI